MMIELTLAEMNFLQKYLPHTETVQRVENAKLSGELLARGKYPTGRYRVHFSDEELEAVENTLADLLVSIGLNENDEPNAVGIFIEALIDKFSPWKKSGNGF